MIEQMYSKEIFFEDAANIVIPSAYADAVDECTEEIVSQPTIDIDYHAIIPAMNIFSHSIYLLSFVTVTVILQL